MRVAAKVLLSTCGSWHLPNTGKALEARGALAGLWISEKNRTGVSEHLYRRCWPFHLATKPFYYLTTQIRQEKMFYSLLPLWRAWVRSLHFPSCNVVQSIMGFGNELFEQCAGKTLKVVDCPNSHPTSYFGFWQRECDLWCPGEKLPIPRRMFARMNRDLEQADLILCPSVFVKETMLLNGIPESKCFVNPFGVDSQLFKRRLIVPPVPRFICVGTICVRKGYQYLFRAFQLVKKVIPNAELICVGQYKVDFRLERRIWETTFRHIPHLDHRDLALLLQTSTSFVFPSQEEGFARVLSEAMGAGLPIIASHESGATTLVRDGIEGFIVRGRDPQHIADAMIRIALDPGLNLKMGKAAFEKGAAKNSWQDYGDRLLEEYGNRLSC